MASTVPTGPTVSGRWREKGNNCYRAAAIEGMAPTIRSGRLQEAMNHYRQALSTAVSSDEKAMANKNSAMASWKMATVQQAAGASKQNVTFYYREALKHFKEAKRHGTDRDSSWHDNLETQATACWSDIHERVDEWEHLVPLAMDGPGKIQQFLKQEQEERRTFHQLPKQERAEKEKEQEERRKVHQSLEQERAEKEQEQEERRKVHQFLEQERAEKEQEQEERRKVHQFLEQERAEKEQEQEERRKVHQLLEQERAEKRKLEERLREELETRMSSLLHGRGGGTEPMDVDEEFCDSLSREGVGGEGWNQDSREHAPSGRHGPPPPRDTPQHWTNLSPGIAVSAVHLTPNTTEFIQVNFDFMSSMTFPATEVMAIFRIQNPFLWRHYTLKQQEMMAENGGQGVLEKRLFHGTKLLNIDAICRKGFDWRVCGRHGTKYGQGCYFARDSRYSHSYCPKWTDPRETCDILQQSLSQEEEEGGQPASHTLHHHHHHPSPPPSSSPAGCGHPGGGVVLGHCTKTAQHKDARLHTDGFFSSTPPLSQAGTNHSWALSQAGTNLCWAGSQAGANQGWAGTNQGWAGPQAGTNQGWAGPQAGANPSLTGPQVAANLGWAAAPPRRGSSGRREGASQMHYMFVARVLAGNFVPGNADYRRPPALQPGNPLSGHFDSCVDSALDPRIFVVFDSNQAYPEYIVEYKRTGGSSGLG